MSIAIASQRSYRRETYPQRPSQQCTSSLMCSENGEHRMPNRRGVLLRHQARNTCRSGSASARHLQWRKAAGSATFPSFLLPLPLELPATSLAALQQHSTVCDDGVVVARSDWLPASPMSRNTPLTCQVCCEALPNHYPTQARALSGCCSARCRRTLRLVENTLAE